MFKNRSKKLGSEKNRTLTLTLMALLPALVIFIFSYMPLPGLVLAFKDFKVSKGVFGSDWVGWQNFEFFFKSNDAWKVLKNTVGLNFVFIFLTLILSVAVALMLNEIRSKAAVKIVQTIMFFPYFVSWIVTTYMVYAFLNHNYGILNSVWDFFGWEAPPWYSRPEYWPYILTIVHLWKNVGYNSVVYYASIMGIDETYYEAAALDGANRWQMMWHITIPNLKKIIICLTTLAIGRIMYADFSLFYQVPRNMGALLPTTDVIDTYIYRAFRVSGNIGLGAAVGCFQAVVGFILIIVANAIVRKIDKESAIF